MDSKMVRVRFIARWKGTLDDLLSKDETLKNNFEDACILFKRACYELEESGVTPILKDGKIAGNMSLLVKDSNEVEYVIVTKSGKLAGQEVSANDLAIITAFDTKDWAAEYYASSENVIPTSDTPMHFAALNAWRELSWGTRPFAILHGHAFETEEKSSKLGFPISVEITLTSTPEDTAALFDLFKRYPYPASNVFVRKSHGFMLLAENIEEGLDIFRKKLAPHVDML